METKPADPKDIECAIRNILSYIGENPNREGLVGTPDRILRMWKEIFRGYDPEQKPKITVFPNGKDGLSCGSVVSDSGTYYSMATGGQGRNRSCCRRAWHRWRSPGQRGAFQSGRWQASAAAFPPVHPAARQGADRRSAPRRCRPFWARWWWPGQAPRGHPKGCLLPAEQG